MCFGESQLTLFGRGVMFLTIGLIILCCPCITWYCCFREKKSTPRYNGNYSNAPQPQPNTMYRPIVQPPQTVPQQGGYGQPSYPVAQSQPQYMQPQQQPVGCHHPSCLLGRVSTRAACSAAVASSSDEKLSCFSNPSSRTLASRRTAASTSFVKEPTCKFLPFILTLDFQR